MFIYQSSFRTKDECIEYYDHLPLEIGSNEFGMHDFRLRVADGERIQQHYTIHFVLRGKGTFVLNDKTRSRYGPRFSVWNINMNNQNNYA